jgi:uncharacterized protein (TIGR01777 family)
MKTGRIVLAGGSGFLGKSLAQVLVARGCEVVVLTRQPSSQGGLAREVFWDGRQLGSWTESLDGADAVINLAGRSVNCRYNEANRAEINASRVDSVRVVGEAIRRCAHPPRVWIQSSSLAIYGDTGDRWCDESAPEGEGFPVDTCRLWESAFNESPTPGVRRVLLRIGFVLGKEGGALQTMGRLTRLGLGGSAGSGRQYISWIHLADMNRIFAAALDREDLAGVFNVATPEPVTNAEFTGELRRALRRPWSPPVPAWAVRIGCWLMRTEACLALTGRRCFPERLVRHGFSFRWPRLKDALGDLYAR